MKTIKLNDKLKYIKKVLKTPYHFFFMTTTSQIMVVFEDKYGIRFTFTGETMYNAAVEAEDYVKSEVKAGSLIELKSIREKDEETNTNNKEDENENK